MARPTRRSPGRGVLDRRGWPVDVDRDLLVRVLVNLIDFEMSLEEAIRTPKFTGYDSYPTLNLENAFPERTVDFLEMMGHVVKEYEYPDLYFGGPNAIEVGEGGTLTGVGSIRRKGGAAAPLGKGEIN